MKIGFFSADTKKLMGTVTIDGDSMTGSERWTRDMVKAWLASDGTPAKFAERYQNHGNGYFFSVEVSPDGTGDKVYPAPTLEQKANLKAMADKLFGE